MAQILFGLYFALISAYLSIVLTRLLKQNGSAINELGRNLSEIIKEIAELVKTESQATRDLISSIKK